MALERMCAWSGSICVTLFFGAFGLAGFVPPMSPSMSVAKVAAHYQRHATGVCLGMGLMMISSALYAVFTAGISGQMRRIPGVSVTAVYTQLACGSFAALTFLMPAIFFVVTAFRPDRAPELTYLMNDLSWIMLVIPWMPFMAQNFAFAYAVFLDKQPNPLFPRWLGFLNVCAPVSFTPGILLPFFKSGPFAWDGLFVFWIPAIIFVAWFFAMTSLLLRAIARNADPL